MLLSISESGQRIVDHPLDALGPPRVGLDVAAVDGPDDVAPNAAAGGSVVDRPGCAAGKGEPANAVGVEPHDEIHPRRGDGGSQGAVGGRLVGKGVGGVAIAIDIVENKGHLLEVRGTDGGYV